MAPTPVKACDVGEIRSSNDAASAHLTSGRTTQVDATGRDGTAQIPQCKEKHLLSDDSSTVHHGEGSSSSLKPCGASEKDGTIALLPENGSTPHKKQRGEGTQDASAANGSVVPAVSSVSTAEDIVSEGSMPERSLQALRCVVVEGQPVDRYLDPSRSESGPGQPSTPSQALASSSAFQAPPPIVAAPTSAPVSQSGLSDFLSQFVLPSGLAAAAGVSPVLPSGEGGPEAHRDRLVHLLRAFMLAKHVKTDSEPCKVMEGLYVGSVGAAYNKPSLQQKSITHIVVVANSLHPLYPEEFNYTVVDVLDSPEVDLTARFEECFEAIDAAKSAGGGALVHCFAGRSRSVTVVTAYVMSRMGLTRDAALLRVRSSRPEASPNQGFLHQLQRWEDRLRAQGVISPAGEDVPGGTSGTPTLREAPSAAAQRRAGEAGGANIPAAPAATALT